MKRAVTLVVALTLIVFVLPVASVVANGPSALIWGVDPSNAGHELVAINAFTGTEITRLPLPSITSTDTEIGLAGRGDTLYYINGDYDPGTVYILDATDGSVKDMVTITGGWDVDGLGWYGGVGGYLYTSGCEVLDVHRYPAGGGAPTFFWSDAYDPRAVGGDDTGRIFTTNNDGGVHMIAELDPVNNVPMINTFASPSQSVVGMAFDGDYLFVSDTQGMLYVLNPDNGTQISSVALPYTLYALAIADIPPTIRCICPKGFFFAAREGGENPQSRTLRIYNFGGVPLEWTVSAGEDWLILSPTSGTQMRTMPGAQVEISVDISDMEAGRYFTQITVEAPGATNSPQQLLVFLQILPKIVPLPW